MILGERKSKEYQNWKESCENLMNGSCRMYNRSCFSYLKTNFYRYHASLELLGERTEQVEELKADIADVKEMYRNQIVELVGKK